MVTLLSILIGCLLIGVILSAPMGPIGILVIQRTMEKGRRSGLYTGIGAAASDLLYCLLAGFGLSFVIDLITKHKPLFQIGGGIVLIVFGIIMLLRNPFKSRLRHQDAKKISFTHDALTGFVLTLLNPLIIFFIFPLFALFAFPSSDYAMYQIILGYLFIVVGALLWWLGITYVVDKLRSKFNLNSIAKINKIMGGIVLVIAVVGLVLGIIAYFK